MKKILFVSNTANFSKFNRPYMKWCKENGWQVDYVSAGEEPVVDCDNDIKIDLPRSPFSTKLFSSIHQMKKILRNNNYDIIHCHTPMGGVVARIAARKYRKAGTKIIYTAHGFHFYKGAPLLNWLCYYPVEKYLAKFSDAIITINREDYDRAKKKFSKFTRILFMNGVGVDLSRFSKIDEEQNEAIRKSLGLDKKDFIITVVAELNKNKNQTMLIKAIPSLLQSIPNLKVLFLGKETLPIARQLVNSLSLTDKCLFLGYRKDVDLFEKISDICFSASLREGLPVNIIESMACGKVCVCSENRGHCSLITNEENGLLFNPNDMEQMKKQILRVYRDKELVKNIASTANKDSKQYDVSVAVEFVAELYNNILEN